MHDIHQLDVRGIPGCATATVEFQQAAEAQGKALGFAPAVVWTPHPIQNKTADELKALAFDAAPKILERIQAGNK